LTLALTAATILLLRRRRRQHQPYSQQEAFLSSQNADPKAHPELFTVETPQTPPTPAIPSPSDGAAYESIPVPLITPRDDFDDYNPSELESIHDQTTEPSAPARQHTISRKPLNGGILMSNQPSGSRDQDPDSTARIPEAEPEREGARASLTRLHIPSSRNSFSVESHDEELSPVSPVSMASAVSRGGGGSVKLGKPRDVSPRR
jgi:hypothetical protein